MGGRDRRTVRIITDLGIRYAHARRLVTHALAATEITSYDDLLAACRTQLESEKR